MSKFIQTLFIGVALMVLGVEAHAQANDVDCTRCVDTSDIRREAVSTNKIRPKAVTTSKIKNGAITENKLSANLSNAMLGTRNPLVLDGGDNLIGYLVNIYDDNYSIDVFTEQGYVLSGLNFGSGRSSFAVFLWFLSADCTGTAFTSKPNGFVFEAYDETGTKKLYYTDKNSAAQSDVPVGSGRHQFGCGVAGGPLAFAWLALANVPGTTGVSTLPYPTPLKIEYSQ